MKALTLRLLQETDSQLRLIHLEEATALGYSRRAIAILMPALDRLKEAAVAYEFEDRHSEIEFFRELKPELASRIIYYNEIYNMEVARPMGSQKAIRRYYGTELQKLKAFFESNREFCTYWRRGSTCLDEAYFLRNQKVQGMAADSFFFQADRRFATAHDYTLARIMASERLQLFLEERVKGSEMPPAAFAGQSTAGLRWTGSKA